MQHVKNMIKGGQFLPHVGAALLLKSDFGDCPRNSTVFYHIDVGLN